MTTPASVNARGGLFGPPLLSTARRLKSYRTVNYWEEQGWKLNGYVLEGYYRTFYGSFRGRIELFDSGDHQYYIYSPPSQLRKHPHWVCFMYRGNEWYFIHWSKPAACVDAGILYTETTLRECFEIYK